MNKHNTILGKMLALIPRPEFDRICREANSDKGCKKFSTWDQLVAMLAAQIGGARGLRSIEAMMAAQEGSLYHLGARRAPRRSTLAYANERRNCEVFEKLYYFLLSKVKFERLGRDERRIVAIDATTIEMNMEQFPWAEFRSTKAGIKLHVKFDADALVALKAFSTSARRHECGTLGEMDVRPSEVAVFDRGYADFAQFNRFCEAGVSFVTRLKDNVRREVVAERECGGRIALDATIRLTGVAGKRCPRLLRLVRSIDARTGKAIDLLTNDFSMGAEDVAGAYRKRWRVELFFKALKQSLKIKTFYGRSRNAVMTQVWTALTAYILYILLRQEAAGRRPGLECKVWTRFMCEVRAVMFARRDIFDWLWGVPPPKKTDRDALCPSLFAS